MEENRTPSPMVGLMLVIATNLVSLGMGYLLHGEPPEPVTVTCEVARVMVDSPPCQQPEDEANIEAEEEAAEWSTPE
jgi:hypothetical protein